MKSKKLINFENEWNAIEEMKIFEIEVLNRGTGETDYLIFDIFIAGTYLVAQHAPLTIKEEKSKKIAFKRVKIDPDFSIGENLQALYEVIEDAIMESDFFRTFQIVS